MKPHNFENQVKEALKDRQIEPRPESWDRLNAMLTANEAKPVRKMFPYWNIAAAVAVFIGIFSFYLFQSEPVIDVALPENQVVSSEITAPESNEPAQSNTGNSKDQKINQISSFNQSIKSIKSFKQKAKAAKAAPEQAPLANETIQSTTNAALAENVQTQSQNTSEVPVVPTLSDEARVAALSDKLNKRPRFKTNPNALLEASNQKAEREYQNQMVATVVKRFAEVKGVVQNRNTVK
jgi:hypothetical protein